MLKRERDILHIPRDVDMLRTALFTGPARDAFGSLAMPSLMQVGIIHLLQYRVVELLQLVVNRKIPRDRDALGAIVHAIEAIGARDYGSSFYDVRSLEHDIPFLLVKWYKFLHAGGIVFHLIDVAHAA